MELLRIIYLSLTGFGILALIAILISYITYKVRKKLGKIPLEDIRKRERTKKMKMKMKIHDSNSSAIKQHHPRVVRKRNYADNSGNPQQRNRITILNDLLKEDSSNYKRFSSN